MKTVLQGALLLSMVLMLGISQALFAGDIINISTRANISGGRNDVFAGFVIDGTAPKKVIIRGISVDEGVDPNILVLNHFSKAEMGQNNDWQTNANADEIEALASNLQLRDTKDAALLLNLNPGVYDVVLSSSGTAGLALVSVDDLQTGVGKIINISTRANISGGRNDVFAGFVIGGETQKRVIIRGIGVDEGVDPAILILDHTSKAEIGQNNNWQDNANAHEIESLASNLQLRHATDAGLLLDMEPGVYDVVLSSGGSSGLALVSVDEVSSVANSDSIFILGLSTEADPETQIGGVLAPNIMATISTTRLPDNPIKVIVDTESGEQTIVPSNISEDRQSVGFLVPADIIDGNLTLQGQGYTVALPYTALYSSTPYIKTLTPDIVQAGATVEIIGVNLPETSIQLVFEGQDSSLSQMVTASAGKVLFTVPEDLGSGDVYLQVAQLQTNRLNLSVKRTINAQVRLGAEVNLSALDISFILGLKEHRLNINYTTELAVEKNALQYLHAMVDLPNDASSLLFSAVVLPDMSGTLTVDAKSTAVAWVFMGMGTSIVTEKDQWRYIYDSVAANAKVQAFADYIDTLHKDNFSAWSTRSDSLLKSKFQDALRDVIQSNLGNKSARIATQFESDTGVIIKQDPANENIYIDQQQLDGGNVTIINDTKLYLSVEVKDKENNQIVNNYRHVLGAIVTDGGKLISPKGWGNPLFGISSSETLKLNGIDSTIEVITAAWGKEIDKEALSNSLRARVFIEGVAVPAINMFLLTIADKSTEANLDTPKFVLAMDKFFKAGRDTLDPRGVDFMAQLITQVSKQDTTFGAIVDNLVIMPVSKSIGSCFDIPPSGSCRTAMEGVAILMGYPHDPEHVVNAMMMTIAQAAEKRLLKKSLVLIPVAGWITQAAFFVYDNIDYVTNSASIAESLIDMNSNPKEIKFDVEFPLKINSVLPRCVVYQSGDLAQAFNVLGDGFAPLNNIDPVVSIGVGSDEVEAYSVSISSAGTDMTAYFNLAELMGDGSRVDALHVKNYGYWVTFSEDIRMVSAADDEVYFDSISPSRAITGDTVTLNGCGWIPIDDIEVNFTGEDGQIKAIILDRSPEYIEVKVPDEAIPGYVTVATGNKKIHKFFHIKPFSLNKAMVEKLSDKLDFDIQGYGLSELAHIHFIDHKNQRIEGIASNITDTQLSTGVPDGLAAGSVRIVVELDDGRVSNELLMPKVPNKPTATPDSGTFEISVSVTLAVLGEGELYYRLDEYTTSPEFRYSGPTTLSIDDSEYENIYLYAFARVEVDGVKYDSDIAEYIYYPTNVTPPPLPIIDCPVIYSSSLDDDPNTNRSITINYLDKDNDGRYEDRTTCWYYASAQLDTETPYVDDAVHGIVKEFYESGQLQEVTPYIENKISGTQKKYYESGQLEVETPYLDGNRQGTKNEYYPSGQLGFATPFEDDSEHGIAKGYYESGNIKVETPYINGNVQGLAQSYYESGVIWMEVPYVDDNQHGFFKSYYESGNLQFDGLFVNGLSQGLFREYYESGQVKMETPFVDGEQVGTIKGYYETGELQSEIILNGNILTVKGYDIEGALISCVLYDDGQETGSCMP